jgi:hypothetical protein
MPNIDRLNGVAATDIALVSNLIAPAIASINGKDLVTTSFLLDDYGTDVRVAYSFRKLSSTYSGSAIRVREGLFNSEADIGFDASGNLDEAALLSHCSSNGTGYIVKWYDQSGNGGDLEQTTALYQPQIVTGNAVIKSNGKPVTSSAWSTATQYLQIKLPKSTYFPTTGTYYFFSVCNANSRCILYRENQPTKWQLVAQQGNSSTSTRSAHYSSDTYRKNGVAYTPVNRGQTYTDFSSQSLLTIDGNLDSATNAFWLGYGQSSFDMYDMQELVIYEGDKSSIQSNIETAINTYYSIYP